MDFSDWFTNQIIKRKKKQKENICSTEMGFFLFALFLQVKRELFENYLGQEQEQEHTILISNLNTFFLSKIKHFHLIL